MRMCPCLIQLLPTSIVLVNKRPSPVSNSAADGGSVSKKCRSKRRSFTGIERKLLEEQFVGDKFKDKKSREDVAVIYTA